MNESCKRQPMPWMWNTPSRANVTCIRFRYYQCGGYRRDTDAWKASPNLLAVKHLVQPRRFVRRVPSPQRGGLTSLCIGASRLCYRIVPG